jgi:gas vesicle protein
MKNETIIHEDFIKGVCIGLVSGAVIGGVIALLYAPKSGTETRQIIKDNATKIMNTVRSTLTEASWKVEETIHALKS